MYFPKVRSQVILHKSTHLTTIIPASNTPLPQWNLGRSVAVNNSGGTCGPSSRYKTSGYRSNRCVFCLQLQHIIEKDVKLGKTGKQDKMLKSRENRLMAARHDGQWAWLSISTIVDDHDLVKMIYYELNIGIRKTGTQIVICDSRVAFVTEMDKKRNKPKMAYSRDALLENGKRQEWDKTRVRLERDLRETWEKLERYGATEDDLS